MLFVIGCEILSILQNPSLSAPSAVIFAFAAHSILHWLRFHLFVSCSYVLTNFFQLGLIAEAGAVFFYIVSALVVPLTEVTLNSSDSCCAPTEFGDEFLIHSRSYAHPVFVRLLRSLRFRGGYCSATTQKLSGSTLSLRFCVLMLLLSIHSVYEYWATAVILIGMPLFRSAHEFNCWFSCFCIACFFFLVCSIRSLIQLGKPDLLAD